MFIGISRTSYAVSCKIIFLNILSNIGTAMLFPACLYSAILYLPERFWTAFALS